MAQLEGTTEAALENESADELIARKVYEFSRELSSNRLAESAVDWRTITSRVLEREAVVTLVKNNLERGDAMSPLVSYEIASTDIFVQKAETELRERSAKMLKYAVCSALAVVASIATYIGVTLWQDLLRIDVTETMPFIASLIRSFVITGLFLGAVYLIVSLLRAFLHEWTTLENRAHSLRLGRLFVYLKYASLSSSEEVSRIRRELSAADMERVFGWNIETSTAFKDIRPELVSKNLLSQFVDAAGKAFTRRPS